MRGNIPTAPLRTQVKQITRPYSIDRYDGHDNSKPGASESHIEDATTVDCYLYDAMGGESVIEVGEVEQGGLQGIALAEADIQERDRLGDSGRRYEVGEPIREIPSPTNPQIILFNLERVTHERL